MAEFRPQAILRVLASHDVRFIVIGGLAGAFHDVGWVTEDLDIVIERADSNLGHLAAALVELDARFVMLNPAQLIRPTLERIRTIHGPMLLRTRYGRLDVLRDAGGFDYEALLADGLVGSVAGRDTQIVSLAKLVAMKRAANREKDRRVLPLLEEALASRAESSKDPD